MYSVNAVPCVNRWRDLLATFSPTSTPRVTEYVYFSLLFTIFLRSAKMMSSPQAGDARGLLRSLDCHLSAAGYAGISGAGGGGAPQVKAGYR